MQLLTFSVSGEPYAIESRRVIEVLPRVPARPLPRMPDYLLGVFTYRGTLVPLVDLASRLGVEAPPARLSTRVIVVEFAPTSAPSLVIRLGLVAENVVAIHTSEEAEASLPPIHGRETGYLDRLLRIRGRTVQLIDICRLLPGDLLAGLLPATTAAASPGGAAS